MKLDLDIHIVMHSVLFKKTGCDNYAPVPKQDKDYWSKHDDGIFVMKYLELWDPYVNMMPQF